MWILGLKGLKGHGLYSFFCCGYGPRDTPSGEGMGLKWVDEETVLDPDGQRMGQFVVVAERPVRFAVMKLLTQTDGSLWRDSQQALSPLHDDCGNTGVDGVVHGGSPWTGSTKRSMA